jgi:hypothetical protein
MRCRAWLPLVLMSALGTACGGSPTSPSPPPPRYPNMIGTWSGVEHVFGTINGTFAEGDCALTWAIGSQVDGQFAGSYERSCPTERSSGDVAGIVLPNGVLTTHVAIVRVRVGGSICERTRLNWFEGVVTATSVGMRVSEELACSREEASSIIVRERQISLTKS